METTAIEVRSFFFRCFVMDLFFSLLFLFYLSIKLCVFGTRKFGYYLYRGG